MKHHVWIMVCNENANGRLCPNINHHKTTHNQISLRAQAQRRLVENRRNADLLRLD